MTSHQIFQSVSTIRIGSYKFKREHSFTFYLKCLYHSTIYSHIRIGRPISTEQCRFLLFLLRLPYTIIPFCTNSQVLVIISTVWSPSHSVQLQKRLLFSLFTWYFGSCSFQSSKQYR